MLSQSQPTWKNTLRGTTGVHYHFSDLVRHALMVRYEFYAWNGWVYRTNDNFGDEYRVCLAADLDAFDVRVDRYGRQLQ